MSESADSTPDSETNCHSPITGQLRLGVAGESNLRWAAVDIGAPLEEARSRVDLSPIAAVALGRALSAAALLQRFSLKAPGQLVVEVKGDGPLGRVLAEVDSRGYLRGLVGEPRLETPASGSLAIGWAIGKGLLKVTRWSDRGRYESQVELVSGEIGKDLVHFLEQSQQIRSAALLGVLPKPTGIAEAGGILIEAFPGTPEETLSHLESNIASMGGNVSAPLEEGGLGHLLDTVLDGMDQEELERHELRYGCGRGRDSLLQKLETLSSDDVDSIVDDEGRFAADCVFCGRRFVFAREELDSPAPTPYVAMALDAVAAGRAPDPAATAPYGCSVKYAG